MGITTVVSMAIMLASVAGLASGLVLSWHLKRQTRALDRRVLQDRKETVAAVELLRAALRQLETEVARNRRDVEELPAMSVPVSVGQSMNMTKRTQVLRMHRRGEPLEQIASVLGLPHKEVELLIKLQDAARYGTGASA